MDLCERGESVIDYVIGEAWLKKEINGLRVDDRDEECRTVQKRVREDLRK